MRKPLGELSSAVRLRESYTKDKKNRNLRRILCVVILSGAKRSRRIYKPSTCCQFAATRYVPSVRDMRFARERCRGGHASARALSRDDGIETVFVSPRPPQGDARIYKFFPLGGRCRRSRQMRGVKRMLFAYCPPRGTRRSKPPLCKGRWYAKRTGRIAFSFFS